MKLKESQLIPIIETISTRHSNYLATIAKEIIETISTRHSNYLATIAKENNLDLDKLIVNIEVELKVIDTDSVEIIENNDN